MHDIFVVFGVLSGAGSVNTVIVPAMSGIFRADFVLRRACIKKVTVTRFMTVT